jgi:phenylalanyl-tRNA synthetase beta chain
MRLSLSWIARSLGMDRLPVDTTELKRRLTLRTAEVGAVHATGPDLTGFVVGRVLTCAQHPNADRLRTTTVDVGGGKVIPVVCGAPNCAEGLTVAVALPGAKATVPGKDGQPTQITIKAGKLRGEPSEGMLCAADELGLPGGHDGLLVLDGGLVPGTPLAQVVGGGDTVVEIENIAVTHRPDLWGHRGWAREVAAAFALPAPAATAPAWSDLGAGLTAAITDPGCPTWLGAVVEGVSDGPSPEWMRTRLEAVGSRSLGRLVDITNWVMLELGHPMHAFDRDRLRGGIEVRPGRGEAFAGLDGRTHTLTDADVVIADQEGPAALGGVVGGTRTAVHAGTTAIVLEAAVFQPARIRRSRQRLAIATDAAARFEKGLTAAGAMAAMELAVQLYLELCPGARLVQRLHAGSLAVEDRRIPFDPAAPARLAGVDIPADQAVAHLAALGIVVEGGLARIPWWRVRDLNGAHDLAEEVIRSHGYDRIVGAAPRLPMVAPAVNPLRSAEHRVRDAASALGWDEVAGYAFTSDAWADALGWAEGTRLRLSHPLSSEQTVLRQSLLPGLAAAAALNRKHCSTVRIIEVGRRYAVGISQEPVRDERSTVAGIVVDGETPFYAARDAALALAAAIGLELAVQPAPAHPALVAGRSAQLVLGKQPVGVVGELPGALRRLADLPERAAWFELDLETLAAKAVKPVQHRPPSRFQRVEREFTFVAPEALPFAELAAGCRQGAGDLAAGVELVTIYRGDPIPAGSKAVSLRVGLQAADRTLDEKALNGASERIVTTVGKRTGAVLRA